MDVEEGVMLELGQSPVEQAWRSAVRRGRESRGFDVGWEIDMDVE